MANEWWMNNRNNMRGYGNAGVTTAFNPNSMAAMVGRSNWLPQNKHAQSFKPSRKRK